jgi:hypothetical protein
MTIETSDAVRATSHARKSEPSNFKRRLNRILHILATGGVSFITVKSDRR